MRSDVDKSDVATITRTICERSGEPFVLERVERNVSGPTPTFSREHFWYVLFGCLITTRQRSTKGTPVNRFLSQKPFPLSLADCSRQEPGALIKGELTGFGGIRMAPTISTRACAALKWLNDGGWIEVERNYDELAIQRSSQPHNKHAIAERRAAHFAQELPGFGPKQSRNLWQWLGLTRYEIPLDSRLASWISTNLSTTVDPKRLSNRQYYESILDYLQLACREARVLPCVLDAAAFDFEDTAKKKIPARSRKRSL